MRGVPAEHGPGPGPTGRQVPPDLGRGRLRPVGGPAGEDAGLAGAVRVPRRRGGLPHRDDLGAGVAHPAVRPDRDRRGQGRAGRAVRPERRALPYDRPQRMLSVIYLEGVRRPADDPDPRLHVSFFPGTGEVVSMPGLTTTGRPCEIVMWEAVPGGPFDCWQDRPAPEAFLERTLKMLREYAPWEHELFTDAVPTDRRCTLFGGYAPIVRHPVGRLSADSHVLGMADVVVANDPISAQGANNAARCADVYLKAILEHGDRPFDPAWMQRTFDVFWQHAEHSARFSNLMLNPPEHVQKALGAAQTNPAVARRLVYGYNEPADFQHWLYTPEQVDAYLASVADQASAPAD
ncbi:styrene monooxygenase/indole monooxygenase family protein [Nocardiopsis composta]